MVLHKNRHIDQWNRNRTQRQTHRVIQFLTKILKTQVGEKTASLTHSAGKTGYSHAEE